MRTLLYQIRCLTNMHVGSGETAYNIIDNQVEKDPVLKNTAVIHPSGVKGAIKAFFSSTTEDKEMLDYIFGNEVETADVTGKSQKKTVPGNYKFLGATLVARPFRVSRGHQSYLPATTPEVVNHQLELFRMLGIRRIGGCDISALNMPECTGKIMVTDTGRVKELEGKQTVNYPNTEMEPLLKKIIAPSFAVVDHEFWEQQEYPVVARNCLNEQGISENLWYEEIVPHESVFYFAVLAGNQYIREFKEGMEQVIQFGANASIGYGLGKVHCLADCMEEGNE